MGVDPLGKAVILLSIPSPFELCAVFAFAVQFEVVVVLEPGEFSRADRPFGKDCGNEKNPFCLGQNKVPRQHHGPSNTNRGIDRGQLHLRPGGGIVAAIEAVEVGNFPVFLLVAYAGVEHESGMRVRGDAVAEIRTDQGAFNDLAKAIGDVDVPDLQFIDGPHIGSAHPSLGFALGGDGFGHVRPQRHILRREGAACKWLFNMKSLPACFELILIALRAQKVPDVFDGHIHCPLEQCVR